MTSSTTRSTVSSANTRWPLERVLFSLAGTLTVAGAILAMTISPWFALLPAFVGANQLLYASVGACPASLVLEHMFGVQRGCARRS